MTTEGGDQFMWWAHEKSKVAEGGNIKGLNIMTGFTNSQKLSWMNNIIWHSRYLAQSSLKNSRQQDMSGYNGFSSSINC
jgi:hypothetical protein